jgi:predicted Zn-ribbon and HTH transcriptional regulator
METTLVLPQLACKRCGHEWNPRIAEPPKRCPECKSPYWNKERKPSIPEFTPEQIDELRDWEKLSWEARYNRLMLTRLQEQDKQDRTFKKIVQLLDAGNDKAAVTAMRDYFDKDFVFCMDIRRKDFTPMKRRLERRGKSLVRGFEEVESRIIREGKKQHEHN